MHLVLGEHDTGALKKPGKRSGVEGSSLTIPLCGTWQTGVCAKPTVARNGGEMATTARLPSKGSEWVELAIGELPGQGKRYGARGTDCVASR